MMIITARKSITVEHFVIDIERTGSLRNGELVTESRTTNGGGYGFDLGSTLSCPELLRARAHGRNGARNASGTFTASGACELLRQRRRQQRLEDGHAAAGRSRGSRKDTWQAHLPRQPAVRRQGEGRSTPAGRETA